MSKIVAIDGPAGSGKGTVCSLVAKKCNLLNIDTGATYRCIALEVLRNNISINDVDKITEIAKNINIKLGKNKEVFLNNEDVTKEIRSKEVTEIVSQVSSIEKVREYMVDLQRKIAGKEDVILDGRDITTVVFPNANYKFYLDSSLEERVNRRYKENLEKNLGTSYEEIYENIKARDYNDMNKKVGALKRTDDQIYIDSTNMTIDEVVDKIVDIIKGE